MSKQNYKRLEDIVKMSKINLDDLTMQQQQNGTIYADTSYNTGGWNGYSYSESIDFSTLEEWLKSGKLDHEKDLIDLVGKMIMERLDQLLDEDTDKLVRILVENKLFKDENIGLRKEITELNSRIDELEARLSAVEGLSYRFRQEKLNHYDNPYTYGTSGPLLTTINTTTNDAASSISSVTTTTNDKSSMMDRLTKLFGNGTQPTA